MSLSCAAPHAAPPVPSTAASVASRMCRWRRWTGASVLLGLAACSAVAHAASPPFPLGVYAGNPNGNSGSAEASFEARFNSFATTMQAAPTFMNAFTDFSQPPSAWPGNAGWTAWSWANSKVVKHTVTPVIGIPMADNAHWYKGAGGPSDQFFKAIVAGTYDTDYAGIVDAWAKQGYKTMYLRLGYEMDGGFMPWFMGSDTKTQKDWVAAFRHLASLMRSRAGVDGAVAYTVWNPADINWTQLSVAAAYPGDDAVDVISSDTYSPLYPTSLYDWVANNGTYDATIAQWWAQPANDRHFWSYPSASQWKQTGTGAGWGMLDVIAMAAAHHKKLAISECGAGGNGTTTGPLDVAAFPAWLADSLGHAGKLGVTVAFVNIWDVWLGDGNWAFSDPTDDKPLEAAAWARSFGVSTP